MKTKYSLRVIERLPRRSTLYKYEKELWTISFPEICLIDWFVYYSDQVESVIQHSFTHTAPVTC